jgi:hypothetical protein
VQQLQQFRTNLHVQVGHACDVASQPAQAGDKPDLHRITDGGEDDGCRRGRRLCCHRSRGGQRGDDSHLALNQIGCHGWQSIVLTFSPAVYNCHVPALDKAGLAQALEERG